jgi:3-hydroxybutyryl-CoA dehydratase
MTQNATPSGPPGRPRSSGPAGPPGPTAPAGPISVGYEFPAITVEVTRAMIRRYAEASYDFNPLHLDEGWMAQADFGGTRFAGIIAHGLMIYSFAARMITDVIYPLGGWHERAEMRFKAPVRPGDTITVSGRITHVRHEGDWILYAATVAATRHDGVIAQTGDANGRIPVAGAAPLRAFMR